MTTTATAMDRTGQHRMPTVVTIPCFSGAPWDLEQLTPLPDGVDSI